MQGGFFILSKQTQALIPQLHADQKPKWILGDHRPVAHWHHIIPSRQQGNVLWKELRVERSSVWGGINQHSDLQEIE